MVAYKHNKGQTLTTDTAEPADRSFISHIFLDADACAAADTDGIITIELGEEEQTIEEGFETLPSLRNLTVTGGAAGMTGDVVITGTNGNGETISETFALDETDTIAGTKAFAAVTMVEAPAQTTAGDTVLIGWGAVYGLPYRLAQDTVLCAFVDNTKETTPPTVTCDPEHIEGNTIALNTAPNGERTDLYLIV